ncbi:transposase [Nocardiopsis alba]|uniref:ISAzo13-like element transposase-related protein n=1 Tax=Nocardiopsis alba TaxID=53437 RepID=UPI0033A4DF13
MTGSEREVLAAKFSRILPLLNERERRVLLGAEAWALGHGGIRTVARTAGVSEATVSQGVRELGLRTGVDPGRARRAGAGRRRRTEEDPGILPALSALLEPEGEGPSPSPLRWSVKSTRELTAELGEQGHVLSADTVAKLLREQGFLLQGPRSAYGGKRREGRHERFRAINDLVLAFETSGDPVVHLRARRRILEPSEGTGPQDSNDRCEPSSDEHSVSSALATLRMWWTSHRSRRPRGERLLIVVDSGEPHDGANGIWEERIRHLGRRFGVRVSSTHLPLGIFRWRESGEGLRTRFLQYWPDGRSVAYETGIRLVSPSRVRDPRSMDIAHTVSSDDE